MLNKLFVVLGFLLLLPCSVHAAVVINEIFPKTEDVTYQWIELYNNGNEAMSLDRWKIEHTAEGGNNYTMNASVVIPPKGFLTLDHSTTGITLYKEGDTVRLFNEQNNQMDSQTYPSTLGWNTSMGRSIDGAGVWTHCDNSVWTKNLPNKCPPPPNTPTPLPTQIPNTPIPPSVTLAPTPTIIPSGIPSPLPTAVLGITIEPTPQQIASATDSTQADRRRFLGVVGVIISVVWLILISIAFIHRRSLQKA